MNLITHKQILFAATLTALQLLIAPSNLAHDWDASRADAHAPIAVMGDHTHAKGDVMFSYRYMEMDMDGNRDGNDRVSLDHVHDAGFRVTPIDMKMKMHMLGAMYAPTEKLTLMLMAPYIRNDMRLQMRMPTGMKRRFDTNTEGLGDVKFNALIPIHASKHSKTHVSLGVSLPTGSINEKVNTPMGVVHAPYPMQLGSGTYDLLPSITWHRQEANYSLGAQASAVMRTGKNNNGYRLGNRLQSSTWAAYNVSPALSVSGRLNAQRWSNIHGEDKKINSPGLAPTMNPKLRAGKSISAGLGANFKVNASNRLAFEISKPIYQSLDGPQLETDLTATLGWQKTL